MINAETQAFYYVKDPTKEVYWQEGRVPVLQNIVNQG